jgi:hypothetical protein
MSIPPASSGVDAGPRSELARRAEAVRARVRKEAAGHGRDDLVTILDGIPEITADRPVRVIVAGSLKRGKSTLVNTLVGRPLLSILISGHLNLLRTEPREKFAATASTLRTQYQNEAQRGPAAQLSTLAGRMTADLTVAGVASLDLAIAQAGQLVRTILDRAGASELAVDLFTSKPTELDLGLTEPESGPAVFSRGLAEAGSLFPTL